MLLGNGIRFGDGLQPLGGILDVGFQAGEHARHLIAARPVRLVVHRNRHHRHQRVDSGSSPRSARNFRSTPDTSAITTSLTLTPKWSFTFLMSSRSSCANAMLRWPGHVGVERRLRRGERRRHREPARGPACTVSTTVDSVLGTTLTSFSGRVANFIAPLTAISSSLAPPTPFDRIRRRARRVRCCTAATSGWRLSPRRRRRGAPSSCTASRPPAWASVPATFSMTHISHSGRLRSNGSDAMWPQISASSARPPGDGRPMRCRWRSHVEILVLHPHRVVEVEPAVGELLAELRHRLDPQAEFVAQPVEGVAAGDRRGVQLQDRAHVQGLRCGFEVQEAGVETAEPLHVADGRPARAV